MSFDDWTHRVGPAIKNMLDFGDRYDFVFTMEDMVFEYREWLDGCISDRSYFLPRLQRKIQCAKTAIRAGFNKRHRWNRVTQRMAWAQSASDSNTIIDCCIDSE
jgi:hypothetical protein